MSQQDRATEALAAALAEIEAQAWALDRQLPAVLIGAARLALRQRRE